MAKAKKLADPGSKKPGPRIGVSYNKPYFDYLLRKDRPPPKGIFADDLQAGIFIIKPGKYLLMILLI